MKMCVVCGATESKLPIIQYTVRGSDIDTNKTVLRRVNLCVCCDAWGMSDTEKLLEFANIYNGKII